MKNWTVIELKYREMLLLGMCTFVCFLMTFLRVFYTGDLMYLFLSWNLFLAGIPWAVTSLLTIKPAIGQKWYFGFGMILIWVLFFPNAPYILTDLFHLRFRGSAPLWYDLILILSYAWTGLLYGFLSLFDIERIYLSDLTAIKRYVLTSVLLFISGFGIYIGRYLRWNSWDVLSSPFELIYDVTDRIVQPYDHPRTWGVTLLMGVFLIMVYMSLKFVKALKSN